MDTMKFLLAVTAALLFGAVFMSWQGMKQGVKDASPDELAQLKQQLVELQKEVEDSKSQPAAPAPMPEVEEVKAQLLEARKELEMMHLEGQAVQDEQRDAKLKQDEEGLIAQKMLESQDGELKRARIIAQALLIGRVKEYIEDPEYGGFITIEVLMPEQVHVGAILGIRRKTGILGQFRVSDVSPEGAIANPMPGFAVIDPKPGDELIFPPQY